MRRVLTIAVILCQVLVLASLAGRREYIAHTGRTVYLRTAPIDPRDVFRGDYVRLRYEISSVPFAKASAEVIDRYKKNTQGATVYALLSVGEDGLAEVASLAADRPAGFFLKGELASSGEAGWSRGAVPVRYGIESYFMEQGRGADIERMRGSRTTVQVPMEMEVAVAGDGTAVLRGHRWSTLGIGITSLTTRQTGTVPRRKSAEFRITLLNNTKQPMALVSMPGYCSMTLEPVPGSVDQAPEVPQKPFCAELRPTQNDVFVLEAGSMGYVDIDLSDPDWNVIYQGKVQEPGELPWHERFRIVYHPPDAEACAGLPEPKNIWHGRIATAQFHGRGNID